MHQTVRFILWASKATRFFRHPSRAHGLNLGTGLAGHVVEIVLEANVGLGLGHLRFRRGVKARSIIQASPKCVLELEVSKVTWGSVSAGGWRSEAGVAAPLVSRLCRSHILDDCGVEKCTDLLPCGNPTNLFIGAWSWVSLVIDLEPRISSHP